MRQLMPIFTAFVLALAIAGGADAAAKCKDPATGKFIKCPPAAAATVPTPPKQCKDPKTGKFIKCPSAAAASVPAPPAPAAALPGPVATGGHPHCVKGKVCGNACIAQNKVCHK